MVYGFKSFGGHEFLAYTVLVIYHTVVLITVKKKLNIKIDCIRFSIINMTLSLND